MSWLWEQVDLYCERIDGHLWSEPLNFFSNFAFYIAAARIFYLRQNVSSPRYRRELSVLGGLALLIGTGSAFFHSWATRLSQIADVVPIALFIVTSLYFYIRSLKSEGIAIKRLLAMAALTLSLPVALAAAAGWGQYLANGVSYLGIAPTLLLFAGQERVRERKRRLSIAAGLFILAYIFRTLDQGICDIFPYGTHFLWHLFTTATAYMMASIQAATGLRVKPTDKVSPS
ncbi:MAG: ceramidase domain-containing protein [Bdellovibrionota bacterium]|nr:MAG: hypothetical protein EOP10_29520 [Pseudomonadota bacterium]